MLVQIQPPTTVLSNKVTVATSGTRVVLGSQNCLSVTITALTTNAGVIYVGGSGVTSANGHQLTAGSSVSLDINSLGAVWIDAANSADSVTYLCVA